MILNTRYNWDLSSLPRLSFIKINQSMKFNYELQKGSKKHNCPNCGKKTLVRYVNQETGEYLSPEYGRCDRENKCGYFLYPKGHGPVISYSTIAVERPKPTSYHPFSLVIQCAANYQKNNFIVFLKSIFPEGHIEKVLKRYSIGTSKYWKGATVFWQIDQVKKVRHGKIMLYDKITGKRIKRESGGAFISSVRAALKLNDFNLKQCLFGLHLVDQTNHNPIAIVESEKTAVIMSLFKPEYLWLATGSKNGFKYDYLKPLRSKKVIAFPDKGEYIDWLDKANELKKMGFDLTVSNMLEKTLFPSGTDLADMYLYELQQNSAIQEGKPTAPVMSTTEQIISSWANTKPEIWDLIAEFELEDHHGKIIRKFK